MDVIDGKWIEARLSATHGARKALADAIGLTPDKITKIMKGERAVKAHEIPLVMRYFDGPDQPIAGFGEPHAQFLGAPIAILTPTSDQVMKIAALAAPFIKSPITFIMQRNELSAGLLVGDLLIAELGSTAATGDLVLVTLNDPEIDVQTTVLRRFVPPLLVALTISEMPISLSTTPSLASAVLATVKAVVRAPMLAVTL